MFIVIIHLQKISRAVARADTILYNIYMANKKTTSKAERTVKKAARKNPKAFIITIVALVLIVAVALAVIYFAAPDTWNMMVSLITGDSVDNGNNSDGNNNGGNRPAGGSAAYGIGTNNAALTTSDGALTVHYINVGQGDCIYIQLPDGKDFLIDSGNSSNSGTYKTQMLDYLDDYITDGQIDYLMLTHGDSDHCYYLDEIFAAYDVDYLFMPNIKAAPFEIKDADSASTKNKKTEKNNALAALPADFLNMFTDEDTINTEVYIDFFTAALSEPDIYIYLNVGDFNISTSNYKFNFYGMSSTDWASNHLSGAEQKNAVSPIGILEYNGFKLVFTGDSNELNEPTFVSKVGSLDCDVLKVGHHGSETSSTASFLDCISCEYAVISCNEIGNTYIHPRQATLERLSARDMTVYRTDNNGNIVLTVNTTLSFTMDTTVSQTVNLTGADTDSD